MELKVMEQVESASPENVLEMQILGPTSDLLN